MTDTCGACRFCLDASGEWGECHYEPPPIVAPVVMYDAITVYHEWGIWSWETDYWGNVTRGEPPSEPQKALYLTPYIVMLALLAAGVVALVLHDLGAIW